MFLLFLSTKWQISCMVSVRQGPRLIFWCCTNTETTMLSSFSNWHKRGLFGEKSWINHKIIVKSWTNWFIFVIFYYDCDCLFLRKVEQIRIFISVIVLQLSLWSFDESKRRGKGWIAQFHSSFSILRQFLFFSSHIFGIFVVAIFTIFGKHVTIFLLA